MWPGCTTSKTPWHIITFFPRGRGPTMVISSPTVLTLWLRNLRLASSMNVSPCHILEPDLAGLRDRLGIPQRCLAPVIDLLEYVAHALFETNLGAPSKVAGDSGDICMRNIGFARSFRNMDDFTAEQLYE